MNTNAPIASASAATPRAPSLADFNLRTRSERPFALDLVVPGTDAPVGITLQVIGEQSDVVKNYLRRELNAQRQQDALRAAGKQKDAASFSRVEDDESFILEGAVIRVVGWNLSEPFSPELARQFFTNNFVFCAQVMAASAKVANFM